MTEGVADGTGRRELESMYPEACLAGWQVELTKIMLASHDIALGVIEEKGRKHSNIDGGQGW